jgi:predicted anti-sigma-YlaC factor YlaD
MSCKNVQERISLLLDRKLQAKERENVLAHMGSCRKCGAYFESHAEQKAMLGRMSQPAIPEVLAEKLRVLASHERVRQLTRVSFSTRLTALVSRIRLEFDNLMRPVALPFTGGLLSALILFSLLVPSFHN